MDTLYLHRDWGKPSVYIFTLRSGEDVADEHWDIRAVNNILETAPLEYAGRLQDIAKDLLAGEKATTDVIRLQEEYNRISAHLHNAWRIVSLIGELQMASATEFRGSMAEYPHAEEEFPKKYQMLVQGLSAKALQTISDVRISKLMPSQPENTAHLVYEQLMQDREKTGLIKLRRKAGQQSIEI